MPETLVKEAPPEVAEEKKEEEEQKGYDFRETVLPIKDQMRLNSLRRRLGDPRGLTPEEREEYLDLTEKEKVLRGGLSNDEKEELKQLRLKQFQDVKLTKKEINRLIELQEREGGSKEK